MRRFVDSNILCRFANHADPQYQDARQALDVAIARGDELLISPQVEREFWVVATRPRDKNGLGMTPEEAHKCLRDWREDFFGFAPDSPAVHANWQALVTKYSVSGKEAHDAAIVAAAKSANTEQILTFNTEDFRRFSPEIAIRTPKELIQELAKEPPREQRQGPDQPIARDQEIER